MRTRAIGLEIGGGKLHAVQLVGDRSGVRFEHAQALACDLESNSEGKAPQDQVLQSLFKGQKFSRRAQIALALSEGLAFAQVDSDLERSDQVRRILRFETERDFPSPPADLLTEAGGAMLGRGGRRFLVAATGREGVERSLALLHGAGVDCHLLETEAGAVNAAAVWSHPEATQERYAVLHCGNSGWVAIVGEHGVMVSARMLHWLRDEDQVQALARELELSWMQVFSIRPPPRSVVLLGGSSEATEALTRALVKRLRCEVTALDPGTRIARFPRQNPAWPLTVAVGLALRAIGVGGPGMDFHEAHFLRQRQSAEIRRGLRVTAVLAGLLAVVLGLRFFGRLWSLEREHRALQSETRALFQKTLPDEPNMVHPLPQLEARLAGLGEEFKVLNPLLGGGHDPLRLLLQVSGAVPEEIPIQISELLVVGATASVRGTAATLEAVDRAKRRLEKVSAFESVKLDAATVDRSSGQVRFIMTIKSR